MAASALLVALSLCLTGSDGAKGCQGGVDNDADTDTPRRCDTPTTRCHLGLGIGTPTPTTILLILPITCKASQ